MGTTTSFKIGHKWGDGYFYHFTARVYFFTFTSRLKEKLLRLNIFYDYRLRFVNFYALRLNLFAVSSVWVNPIKILLKLKNRLKEKGKGKKDILSLCFLVDQVWEHPRSRLRKRFSGWSQLHSRSAISHPSLVHSSRSVRQSKTVQFPKQFSHTSLFFWWTKS